MQPLTCPPVSLRELMGGGTLRLFHLVLGALTVKETDAVNKAFGVTVTNLCEFHLTTAQSVTLDTFYQKKKSPQQLALRHWLFLLSFLIKWQHFIQELSSLYLSQISPNKREHCSVPSLSWNPLMLLLIQRIQCCFPLNRQRTEVLPERAHNYSSCCTHVTVTLPWSLQDWSVPLVWKRPARPARPVCPDSTWPCHWGKTDRHEGRTQTQREVTPWDRLS